MTWRDRVLFWSAHRLLDASVRVSNRLVLDRRSRQPFRPTLDDQQLARVLEFSSGEFAIFSVPDAQVESICYPRAVCYRFHVKRS